MGKIIKGSQLLTVVNVTTEKHRVHLLIPMSSRAANKQGAAHFVKSLTFQYELRKQSI